MRKTYIFKLYHCKKKNKHLHQRIELAGKAYNHLLAIHKRYYRLFGKSLNKYKLKKHLPKLKAKYPEWHNIGSQALQDIVFRLDFGYSKFFDWLKAKKAGKKVVRKCRPPKFRKLYRFQSFTLTQAGWKLLGNGRVKIGKYAYKFIQHREILGDIKTLTVKRDALGDIYLCFSCDHVPLENNTTPADTAVGLDFGLKTFLTTSEGEQIQSPLFFKRNKRWLKKVGQSLQAKQKKCTECQAVVAKNKRHKKVCANCENEKSRFVYSNNWHKARLKLAKVHKKTTNQRSNFHFQLAKKLADTYQHIFVEDLNLHSMQKMWGRKISDLGFGDFRLILNHQRNKRGLPAAHKVGKFFASSKLCSSCGWKYQELTLRERQWECKGCGTTHDRDHNAAINIHREGMSTLGLEDGRREARQPVPAFSVEAKEAHRL